MPRVVARYRYPVKGLTAESCEVLSSLRDGLVAFDVIAITMQLVGPGAMSGSETQ